MKNRHLARALTAGITAAALSGLVALPAAQAAETVTIVDPDASPATRSLFSYLDDVRGEGILFGHQHTTSYGLTVTGADGTKSDVKNMTGDYPAVFGWDTLILQGDEAPGSASNTTEQNIAALDDYIEKAHALGGINTLSAHMENFVTGGSFYDTTGDTLRAVLPGGAKNADLNAYLDNIAAAADGARDAEGDLIPIIFRPWHENAGSWFWWGAAFGSPGEYKELFRYTVEYLRDIKGVSNFLYAFGPGSGFGGNADTYLRTYPGDEFVDVFGLDAYDNTGSAAFLDGLVKDLGMIADLADAKGKVSAFTEFGVTNGVGTTGSSPEQWFTKVLAAIKADPKASRNAYMETWANFDAGQHYVPVTGDALLPDFQDYAADPYTLFAGEVTGAFDRDVDTTPAGPVLHIASPADSARVATSPTTIRATVQNVDADRVYATVGDTEIELAPGDGLWWSAPWDIPAAQLDNSTQTLTVHVVADGVEVLTESSSVVLGPRPTFGPGVVDDYEGYGDDTALRAEYVSYGANTLSLDTSGSSKALRMDYDFATQTYTGFGKQISGDWSDFNELALLGQARRLGQQDGAPARGRRRLLRGVPVPGGHRGRRGDLPVRRLATGPVGHRQRQPPHQRRGPEGDLAVQHLRQRGRRRHRRPVGKHRGRRHRRPAGCRAAAGVLRRPAGLAELRQHHLAARPGPRRRLPGRHVPPDQAGDPRGRGVAALPLLRGHLRPHGEEADVPRRAQEARLLQGDRVAGAREARRHDDPAVPAQGAARPLVRGGAALAAGGVARACRAGGVHRRPVVAPVRQGHRVGDRDRHHRADVGHQVRRPQGRHAR